MKFSISADALQKIIGTLLLKKRPDFLICLSAVAGDNDGSGHIKLEGVSRDISFSVTTGAAVMASGEVTLNSRDLLLMQAVAGTATVTLRIKNTTKNRIRRSDDMTDEEWRQLQESRIRELHVDDTRGCKNRIPVIPREFLPLSRGPEKGTATVDLKPLQQLLGRVVFATGNDSLTEYKLGCVQLLCGHRLTAVAADGKVGAIAHMPQAGPYSGSFLLAREAVNTVLKLTGADMLSLQFYDRGIGFLLSGKIAYDLYVPEYTNMFPDVFRWVDIPRNSTVSGPREAFLEAIEAVQFCGECVHLQLFRQNGYTQVPPLLYGRLETGQAQQFPIAAQWEGDPIDIKINRATLMRAVEQAGPEVTLYFTNDLTPYVVQSDNGAYVCGLTPYAPERKGR